MAWTISTFANTVMTGSPSVYRTAMFELCRAVNEREAAIGQTKTVWNTASGGSTADISMAQLLDLWMSGAGNGFCVNMTKIQTAIVALLGTGRFVQASGVSSGHTRATMEAAIGTNLTTAPTSVVDTRFWQAQKDALDRMIYCASSASVSVGSGNRARRTDSTFAFDGPADHQEAWDKTLAKSPTRLTQSLYITWALNVSRDDYVGGFTDNAVGEIYDDITGLLVNSNFQGTLTAVRWTGRWEKPDNSYFTGSMTAEWGSVSATKSSFSGTALTETIVGNVGDINWGGSTTLTLNATAPTTVPFSVPHLSSQGADHGSFAFGLLSAGYYHDIASLLTDQT